jgi:hypothetical protein
MRQRMEPSALAAAMTYGAAWSLFACGDIVIPNNTSGDSDASALGEAGLANIDGAVSIDARPPPNCDAGTHPVALSCTGLYSNWTQLTLSPDVVPFEPGTTMWVDGADSSRWVWLPPGQRIDASDINNWSFPVGTKFWQEMKLLGSRVETRFLWKLSGTIWFRTTYLWSDDQSAAPELTTGLPNARGLPYDVPPVSDCEKCHNGANDFVLGFELVGLAMPMSSGLNLHALVRQGSLSSAPTAVPTVPGDPTTAAALALLHTNCGIGCHNRNVNAGAGQTGLLLKLTADSTGALPAAANQTDTWTTAYRVPSEFTPAGNDAGGFWRIAPGDVAHSMIPWRMSRRGGVSQMPPIDTHLVDLNGTMLLQKWIAGLQAGPDASAAP